MSCLDRIEEIGHEVLLEGATFKKAREFIETYCDEVYHVQPGYRLFHDCYLVGIAPIALGIKGTDLVFPAVRPRLGTFVIKIKAEEEIRTLREANAAAES